MERNPELHIWELYALKLTGEATERELLQLEIALSVYPELEEKANQLKALFAKSKSTTDKMPDHLFSKLINTIETGISVTPIS